MMYGTVKNQVLNRGFTLLIALIYVSVILSVGLALADVSYKQEILASTAKNSEYAFYNADAAIECALELDQQYDAFDYGTEPVGDFTSKITCEGESFRITGNAASLLPPANRISTFSLYCPDGGTAPQATVTILKNPALNPSTYFYSDGFNDCNVDNPQRVERGLESKY